MPRIAHPDQAHTAALVVAAQREVVDRLRADEARRSVEHARRARMLAELLRLSSRPAHAILEVAGLLRVGQQRAHTMLEDGRRLVDLFPTVLRLIEEGLLAVGTSELLLRVTRNCPEQVQLQLDQRIGAQLVDLDAADARRLIVSTMLEVEADLDPDGQKERHQQAHANRGVWVKPVGDGMARIGAEVGELEAHRFALDLEELVRVEKLADDRAGLKRDAAQRRADVLAELPSRYLALAQAFQKGKRLADLLPSPRPPTDDTTCSRDDILAALLAIPLRNPQTMYVHVPVSTVLDLNNRAAFVEGLGAISAYRSRLVRPTASLSRLWVDHRTGVPLGLDPDPPMPAIGEPDWDDPDEVALAAEAVRQRLRSMLKPTTVTQRAEAGRFPSAGLTRFVEARDLACRGPGCPRTARACELDHRKDHAEGGLTASWNLDAQSTRCHHCKHDGWTVRRYEDGTTVWISPLGSFFVRRSPWLAPPVVEDEVTLLPPTLDRPDGGRTRSDWYAGPAKDLDSRFRDGEKSPELQPARERTIPPAPRLPALDPDVPLLRDWDPPPF